MLMKKDVLAVHEEAMETQQVLWAHSLQVPLTDEQQAMEVAAHNLATAAEAVLAILDPHGWGK